jgi:hypothetical protein
MMFCVEVELWSECQMLAKSAQVLHNIVAVVGVCDMLGSYLASPLYM